MHAYRYVCTSLHRLTAVHLTFDGCMAMSPLEVAIIQVLKIMIHILYCDIEGRKPDQLIISNHFSLSHSNLPHSVPIIYLFHSGLYEDFMIGEPHCHLEVMPYRNQKCNKLVQTNLIHFQLKLWMNQLYLALYTYIKLDWFLVRRYWWSDISF